MKPDEKRKLERFKLQLLSHITVRGKDKDIKTIKLLTQDVIGKHILQSTKGG